MNRRCGTSRTASSAQELPSIGNRCATRNPKGKRVQEVLNSTQDHVEKPKLQHEEGRHDDRKENRRKKKRKGNGYGGEREKGRGR
ncbi:hypothetical protein GW17_00050715 [Ensete ventricosum]|nr:hypothetical protein GW17_00050715 [Ensete ventricosum]